MIAEKEIIAKRIKEFGHKKFKRLAELARQMDLSPQALQTYTEARSIPGGNILFKLRQLGCDINWLLSTDEEISKLTFYKIDDLGILPSFDFNVSTLIPKDSKELMVQEEFFHTESIDFDPKTHVYLKINEENGRSMTPLLHPGDLVLLDTKAEPKDGEMVAARWDEGNGEVRILNIYDDPSKVVLWSFNQKTKPIIKDRDKVLLYKVVMIKKTND